PDQELVDHISGNLESVDAEMDFTSITTASSGPTRVVCTKLVLANGQNSVLVIGSSDRYSANAIQTVATVLLLIFPIGCVSISVAAWLVAGLATRPIEQVQHFAENLDPRKLMTDIDLEGDGAEIESLRQELRRAMQRIEKAYEEQARVLANISHEVKTPISVVQTEAQVLMMKKPSPDEYRSFVKSTSEEMQRLGSMVESFLLLTRVQKNDAKVRQKVISTDDLVLESYEQCQSMARQYHVVLNISLNAGEREPKVLGNADLLCTLVNNLVRNAIRFTPEQESVELYSGVDDKTVIIGVRDHGPGITESLLPRLFEPFTQASSERRKGRGTGLGLQIAKGIAELHGGDIVVRNLDVGCEFEVRLPMAEHD
ncbi:MAG: HAMP domain-containing histidine kinase, partial [Kamptonema sp. SIO4C4]|nr:HAMP domain-containing histidine kinase [Kamptonema sp. SIO4C4]